jgi:hypothetical protein
MIKRFDPIKNSVFSNIIDSIDSSLICPKYKQYGEAIEIDTWENIAYKMLRHKEMAESGFGFCISNYLELGYSKPLIVINLSNCSVANFTDRETGAIIMHELGHLLNIPVLDHVPTILDFFEGREYCVELADKIKKENLKRKEIYADSYAAQNGYGSELISTFHKQNQHFEQKIGFIEERIQNIEMGNSFIG